MQKDSSSKEQQCRSYQGPKLCCAEPKCVRHVMVHVLTGEVVVHGRGGGGRRFKRPAAGPEVADVGCHASYVSGGWAAAATKHRLFIELPSAQRFGMGTVEHKVLVSKVTPAPLAFLCFLPAISG